MARPQHWYTPSLTECSQGLRVGGYRPWAPGGSQALSEGSQCLQGVGEDPAATSASRLHAQLLGSLSCPHTCSLAGQPQDPATFPIRQTVVRVGQAEGPQAGAQGYRLGQQQEGHVIAPLRVSICPMQDDLLQARLLWSDPQAYRPFLWGLAPVQGRH